MQLLTLKKRAAVTGAGLFAACAAAIPFAPAASAAAPQGSNGDNAAINVQTEYNCSTHSLMAEVKNKLTTGINPTVTFNQLTPEAPGSPPTGEGAPDVPIKPGETRTYMYDFSGNTQMIPVKVAVDGYGQLEVDPMVMCQEPVTFQVTEYSEKTVVGYLTNNNATYPQNVTMSAGPSGQRQDISLAPGQSVLVAVPFESYPDQRGVSVTVTNGPDFQSTYYIDLDQPSPVPPVGMPGPK